MTSFCTEYAAWLLTCSKETALKMLCLFWRREEEENWAEARACWSQGTCCHAQDNWRRKKKATLFTQPLSSLHCDPLLLKNQRPASTQKAFQCLCRGDSSPSRTKENHGWWRWSSTGSLPEGSGLQLSPECCLFGRTQWPSRHLWWEWCNTQKIIW